MQLYKIRQDLEALLENEDGSYVDSNSGEILSAEAVDALNMEFEEKIESCLLFIKGLYAESEALKSEAQKLQLRSQTCENKAAWLTSYVQENLKGEKFKTARVLVKYTTSKSATPLQNWKDDTPDCYWKPGERTVDKAQIRKDLIAGKDVKGWALSVKQNLKAV